MTDPTPTPERVTLTDGEREALAQGFSALWAKDLCEEDAEFVHTDPESVAVAIDYADQMAPAFERILAAREQALREEIADDLLAMGDFAWGGDASWLTTGRKVAALAAETVRGGAR